MIMLVVEMFFASYSHCHLTTNQGIEISLKNLNKTTMNPKPSVVILGGGVAGMSAAHELAERGFQVSVYEKNEQYVGGKARSVNAPGTNLLDPKKFLPGEHGFRFFPGFYKHVTDTMKRIPFTNSNGRQNASGVYDNLVATSRILIARYGKNPIRTIANFPRSWKDIKLIIQLIKNGGNTGLTKEEKTFFATRIWQLCSSSYTRRNNDYEKTGWWEYLQADKFSATYRHLLVEGLTRTLVAADAKKASTKTGGNTFLQLVFSTMSPLINTDRVLNGPTNEQWLDPWKTHLHNLGVEYFINHEVLKINMDAGVVSSILIKDENGSEKLFKADYYLLAVPIERAAVLINEEMINADACLSNIAALAPSVQWMNGIQFYLNENVTINHGHIICCDSEWALTAISQTQFWPDYDLSHRFNGKVNGILSIDISNWNSSKFDGHLAENCDPEEVKTLVWEQAKKSLNVEGAIVLRDDMIEHWYLDRDIRWMAKEKKDEDEEPLLVNTSNSWSLRPVAFTAIPNFFLASDYVRTFTDLATMEGANEAARRAVNNIIEASGVDAPLCEIWPLREPLFFKPLRWLDKQRWNKGLTWSQSLPWWMWVFLPIWLGCCILLFPFRLIAKLFQ